VIEALRPALVIPRHGAPFTAVDAAIAVARQRLDGFVANPAKHLQYAAKVLLKFKLLELQHVEQAGLLQWVQAMPYFKAMFGQLYADLSLEEGVNLLVQDLVRSGAATVEGGVVYNA